MERQQARLEQDMKLNRRHLGIVYQLVMDGMEKTKDKPVGYIEDLIELEEILTKEFDRQKDY
jgi:hypothetical protein